MRTMMFLRRSALALCLAAGAASAQPTPTPTPTPTPSPTPNPTPAPAPEQPAPKSAEKLPSGKEVLEKFIEATGGRAAYDKVTSTVSEGTVELKSAGISGTMKLYQQAPALMCSIITIPGVTEIRSGNDGKHAWEVTMMGPRLLTGDELEESNRQAMIAAELNPDLIYKSVECTGVDTAEGEECYVVELVTKGGSTRTAYYSKASGLLVRIKMKVKSKMGEASAESTVGDYRDADGIKAPYRMSMKVTFGMTSELVMTFTSIKRNVEIEAATFAPPKAIEALIKKSESKEAEGAKPEAPAKDAAPAEAPKGAEPKKDEKK